MPFTVNMGGRLDHKEHSATGSVVISLIHYYLVLEGSVYMLHDRNIMFSWGGHWFRFVITSKNVQPIVFHFRQIPLRDYLQRLPLSQ